MLTHYGVNKGSVLNVGITIINYGLAECRSGIEI